MVGRLPASRCVRPLPRSVVVRHGAQALSRRCNTFRCACGAVRCAARRAARCSGRPRPRQTPRISSSSSASIGASAQRRAQVESRGREQAGVQHAVRRQPRAAQSPQNGCDHRGDEADLAGAVVETRSAARPRRDSSRRDRLAAASARDARAAVPRDGTTSLALPAVAVADIHVFDEAHDDAGAAEALDQIEHRVIVDAALDHRVDLDRRESGAVCAASMPASTSSDCRSRRSCARTRHGRACPGSRSRA